LVYNGVDTQRFSPHHRAEHRRQIRARLGVADDEVLFLFVGHDFARKGLATAIRALGHLHADRRPVRLVVVGGKPVGTYKRLADRCGVRSQVAFAGSVADPIPYYAAADAYVLPTFYDPCSLGVLEAAASGLPSITTSLNGASELLTDGVDGYLLADPADDYGLAVPMQWLLDPVLRHRLGEAARQLALQHTLERNCDQIAAIYREIRD
jgi:UDP-glucose:(heptosyl)LPS alpha-1,3-glucosyltransferase